uniref:Uncharacterized protein n=1 Tax=Octopus bimaculoides TaxID=37653 RepID=A0A0L8H450_OCTBM
MMYHFLFLYCPQGAIYRGDKQGQTNGLSRLYRPQSVTGTYLIDLERMKGKVDLGGI